MPPSPDSPHDGHEDGAISLEEIEDAVVDGDAVVPARTGTARAALSHRTFRIVYLGAFGNRTPPNVNDPVVAGSTLFTNNCATCHGASGEGGVGPQLNGGQVLKVWPKLADHINWVHTGGEPYIGKTIGAINIPVPANNVMPAFGMDHGGPLTNQQILDVVCYERVTFGGAPENAQNCPKTA